MNNKHSAIDETELAVHGLSFNDYNAKLFKWNGGLYRGIQPQVGELYRDILERGIVEELVAKKLLIETELTSLVIENYQFVLKHRQLPFVSYPWEWCDLMLKDAALLHLDFCLELERYDLTTGDAHPLNILFDGCQPLFIDFGSIESRSPDTSYWLWSPYEQFCHFFLNPLKLMAEGKGKIARWLLHDYEQGILNDDLEALLIQSPSNLAKVRSLINQVKSTVKQQIPAVLIPQLKQVRSLIKSQVNSDRPSKSRSQFIAEIRQEIVNIKLIEPIASQNVIDWIDREQVDIKRHQELIATILSDLNPSSVLEIDNYNSEPFAPIAANQGSQVVFLSSESARVRQLYRDAKAKQLAILPLLLNFVSPSCDLANRWFSPAGDRLKCELVLAIDLLDRLVFKQYLTFDTIVERLAILGDRVLVEFIPRDPPYRFKWSSDLASRFDWYSLNNFITSLETEFEEVTTVGHLANNRVLLLCTKNIS